MRLVLDDTVVVVTVVLDYCFARVEVDGLGTIHDFDLAERVVGD